MPQGRTDFRRISVSLPPKLVVALDDARPDGWSRSKLIAKAIVAMLEETGREVPPLEPDYRDRAGFGTRGTP